jgi:DNA polymerase-1
MQYTSYQKLATIKLMTKSLYLIDGSGFIFRAYHALPPLTNPKGVPVGAVYGFVNMMTRLMEGKEVDYVAVVFDAARKTFRNRIYPDYKAHRPPAPEDLVPQFAIIREATDALNLPRIELEDYEADDIIATYAKQAQAQGINVTIVSSDKDLMQLIGNGVRMYDGMKQKTIGEEEVKEKFGVRPDKVLEVLSLIGDSSDNVPGVPGIGPKTAAELIGQYGDLETLLERAGEIKQPKRRESLIQYADQAKLSKELITLKTDVSLPPLSELAVKSPAPEKLVTFLHEHGFKSLVAKLQQKFDVQSAAPAATKQPAGEHTPVPAPPPVQHNIKKHYSVFRDEATLARWITKATSKGFVAFDTETTGLNPMQAELVGFSLSTEQGEACYVPLQHRAAGDLAASAKPDLFNPSAAPRLLPGQIPLARAIEMIKPLLEDESVLKIGHNIKYDMLIMRRYGIRITPIEDSMLLSYVLHAGEHGQGMDELASRYLSYTTISYDDVTGTGKNRLRFDEVEIEKAGKYAAEDADVTLRLCEFFKPQLAPQKLLTVYETIERALTPVLAHMEHTGIKVDVRQLTGLSADFAKRMAEYEQEIYALAGQPFNIGSPKQLGEILFDKLQLEGGKKSSKTGAYTTDSDVLEDLAPQHPLPAKVLEWRQLAKLKSTYTDSLIEQIDPKTGRVHTSFAQAIASTGRLSSNDPNLQNIPIRTTEGKKIRNAFIAEQGYKLLSADYSQIELRLLAHVADIAPLKTAFQNGDDIHAITASQMFGMPVSEVNADLRRSAKTINFGIIYGISAHGLSQRLGIGRTEAAAYIERYFKQYPGIRDYMEESKEFARTHGYVVTLFGRRCHLPGIADKNAGRRTYAERAAINAPLQGTAADIIKRAMVSLGKIQNPDCRMLLQVHDELVFEVKESALPEAEPLVKKHMEQAAQLSVPLIVEIGVGNHWGEAH